MKKIIYEKDKCISCGTCSAVCPDHWEMGEDRKAQLKDGVAEAGNVFTKQLEEAGCNDLASQNCPAQCIHVEEA